MFVTSNLQDELCLTPACVQIGAAILDSIDNSVDPCDDFYQFTNGGWLARHPIPVEKGLFGTAQWIEQRNKEILLRILETSPESEDDMQEGLNEEEEEEVKAADKQNLEDLRIFYTTCMDEEALDKMGSSPLVAVVQAVLKAWRGDSHPEKGRKDPMKDRRSRMTDTIALLHSKGNSILSSGYPMMKGLMLCEY